MISLPNKKLNDKEMLSSFLKGKMYGGAEAVICHSDRTDSVYKIFSDKGIIVPMGDCKEDKINILYNKNLDFSTKIISTISYRGDIVGYEMFFDEELVSQPMYNFCYNKEELIYFLKKTKEILEYFMDNDILYGDVADRNILFNRHTGEIAFCDMDNVKIGYRQIDTMPLDLFDYQDRRGIDYGVHPYMHNKMLLRAFGYDEFNVDAKLFKNYLKLASKKTIASMIRPEDFDDTYLIDFIRKLK